MVRLYSAFLLFLSPDCRKKERKEERKNVSMSWEIVAPAVYLIKPEGWTKVFSGDVKDLHEEYSVETRIRAHESGAAAGAGH